MKNPREKGKVFTDIKDDQSTTGLVKKFKAILKQPEIFLSSQPQKFKELSELLHKVYQLAVKNDVTNSSADQILPELILEDMHEEQIWQQLELRNNVVLPQLLEKTAKVTAIREDKLEIHLKEEDDDFEPESEGECEEEVDDDLSDDEGSMGKNVKRKKIVKPSVVDDKFFKLDEMEEFLKAEDDKEMRKQREKLGAEDEDGINYFDDNLGEKSEDEEEDNENPDYKDFFETDDEIDEEEKENEKNNKIEPKDNAAKNTDQEMENEEAEEFEDNVENDDDEDGYNSEGDESNKYKKKPGGELEPDSGSETDSDVDGAGGDDQPKSSFELRQERFQQRIRDYEDEVLGEKPWQLKGEIQATSRPQNSLLEEVLEFETNIRPAPIITEETTRRLEDIIRQRIKDQAWDDVERKVKPLQTPQEFRKQLVLDQEKSKVSLAQVYEKEYQNEVAKLQSNNDDTEKEEPKEHTEIRKLMRALFTKLDALSNFHFTPKPVAPEAKIITNTPAINMEEVAPVAVSDATLLAPEEILKGSKHTPIGESERTKTDKNRDRRKKKQKQRAIHKALEAKDIQKKKMGIAPSKKDENAKLLKTITKHRNFEKITATTDKGSLKSSKAFFSKLQDTTTATAIKATKKKLDMPAKSAKKLKL